MKIFKENIESKIRRIFQFGVIGYKNNNTIR